MHAMRSAVCDPAGASGATAAGRGEQPPPTVSQRQRRQPAGTLSRSGEEGTCVATRPHWGNASAEEKRGPSESTHNSVDSVTCPHIVAIDGRTPRDSASTRIYLHIYVCVCSVYNVWILRDTHRSLCEHASVARAPRLRRKHTFRVTALRYLPIFK